MNYGFVLVIAWLVMAALNIGFVAGWVSWADMGFNVLTGPLFVVGELMWLGSGVAAFRGMLQALSGSGQGAPSRVGQLRFGLTPPRNGSTDREWEEYAYAVGEAESNNASVYRNAGRTEDYQRTVDSLKQTAVRMAEYRGSYYVSLMSGIGSASLRSEVAQHVADQVAGELPSRHKREGMI